MQFITDIFNLMLEAKRHTLKVLTKYFSTNQYLHLIEFFL